MSIHVLFLSAEAEPFVKIGGLGDVAGALPKAIYRASHTLPKEEFVDIRVVLPFHYAIKQKGFKPDFLGEFDVESKGGQIACQVYCLEEDRIPVYFLDGEPIDDQSPVYSNDPVFDGFKFVFFSMAALHLTDFLNWRVDILQANDWHTATAIYALSTKSFSSKNLAHTKTVHTLHNLPFMGNGNHQAMSAYDLPPSRDNILPEWARHSPLPLGLLHADKIVAVSPNYAKEILTPEFGCGLEEFLKTKSGNIEGILNGLDTERWEPASDPAIAQNFSIESLHLRPINKQNLQRKHHLTVNDRIPLLTLISRMDQQKGIDIAIKGLEYCSNLSWQAILLGTGNSDIEEMARRLEEKFPDRVRAVIEFDSKLAHQLYAGADIFMMPSRYEPCGLSQMIAMRYGCVPVARNTGGLADTIKHVPYHVDGGSGFLFSKPFPSVFAKTLERALRFYHTPQLWRQIQLNGMKADYSWEQSALKYIALFKTVLSSGNSKY